MLLAVENLTKNFGNQCVVNHVSFSIDRHMVVGFLGPNGAGKSTTMKIITGFIPPDEGRVLIHGMDMMTHRREVKRLVGYLSEHNPQYLGMYVEESLLFTAQMYGLNRASSRVREVMDMVHLGEEKHKKVGQLSKGYRQRLGLAQAIIHDPKILILDEPTVGLDPNQLQEIRNLISHLGRDKLILLSTHIMQEVEALCEQVLFVNGGKLVGNYKMDQLPTTFEDKSLEAIFVALTR